MVLADLRRRVAKWFEEFGDRWVLVLNALLGGRQADRQQAGAERRLSQDKGGPASGAGLLGVVVGEQRTFVGYTIDVGGAPTHHPSMVGADIPDADIIRHEHDDVWLLGGRLR